MLPLAHFGFFAFGTILVVVGATQAALARGLGIGLQATGALAAAVSLGLGIGVVSAGPLVDRWPRRPLFVAAALAAGLGLLLGARGGDVWHVGLGLGLAGLGAGVFETILNTVVSEIDPARAERRLASVHAAATGGAVVAPPVLAGLATDGDFAPAFLACAAAFGALAVLGVGVRLPAPAGPAKAASDTDAPPPAIPVLLPLLAASAAYVGLETALTAFAPAFAAGHGLPPARGVAAISALWLGLLVGRLAFVGSGRAAGASWLATTGGVASVLIGAGVALELRTLVIGFAVLGFVLGTVFPILIAVTARSFPARRATAIGGVAGAGSLGGALVPWLAGAAGDRLGLPGIWAVLLASCLVLALAGAWVWRVER